MILISTDKAVRPHNVMGASKRVAELIVKGYSKRDNKTCFSMVRFGNVLNSSGSVVPIFKKQIESGGPIYLTHKKIIHWRVIIEINYHKYIYIYKVNCESNNTFYYI